MGQPPHERPGLFPFGLHLQNASLPPPPMRQATSTHSYGPPVTRNYEMTTMHHPTPATVSEDFRQPQAFLSHSLPLREPDQTLNSRTSGRPSLFAACTLPSEQAVGTTIHQGFLPQPHSWPLQPEQQQVGLSAASRMRSDIPWESEAQAQQRSSTRLSVNASAYPQQTQVAPGSEIIRTSNTSDATAPPQVQQCLPQAVHTLLAHPTQHNAPQAQLHSSTDLEQTPNPFPSFRSPLPFAPHSTTLPDLFTISVASQSISPSLTAPLSFHSQQSQPAPAVARKNPIGSSGCMPEPPHASDSAYGKIIRNDGVPSPKLNESRVAFPSTELRLTMAEIMSCNNLVIVRQLLWDYLRQLEVVKVARENNNDTADLEDQVRVVVGDAVEIYCIYSQRWANTSRHNGSSKLSRSLRKKLAKLHKQRNDRIKAIEETRARAESKAFARELIKGIQTRFVDDEKCGSVRKNTHHPDTHNAASEYFDSWRQDLITRIVDRRGLWERWLEIRSQTAIGSIRNAVDSSYLTPDLPETFSKLIHEVRSAYVKLVRQLLHELSAVTPSWDWPSNRSKRMLREFAVLRSRCTSILSEFEDGINELIVGTILPGFRNNFDGVNVLGFLYVGLQKGFFGGFFPSLADANSVLPRIVWPKEFSRWLEVEFQNGVPTEQPSPAPLAYSITRTVGSKYRVW